MLDHLKWPTLAQRRCFYLLTLLYKITHNLVVVPSSQYNNPHQTSTRSNSLTFLPFRCNANANQNSFFPKTVSQWNALPEHIVCAPFLLTFKTAASSDLKWNTHISNTTRKANSILSLLRRNIKTASQTLITQAYQSLVRPHLKYAATVWSPHTAENVSKLEMVQRRAAGYTCNRFHNTSSVSEMIDHLGWESLAVRRNNMRLQMNTGEFATQ